MQKLFLKIIDLASSEREISLMKRELGRSIGQAGFEKFIYLDVKPTTAQLVSNTPTDWQQLYLRANGPFRDPVVLSAKKRMRTFLWDLEQVRTTARTPARDLLAAAKGAGLCHGISTPIKTGFGHLAILTLFGNEPKRLGELQIDEVLAATAVAHLHCSLQISLRSEPGPILPALTPKQAVCLRWAAEGKSMKDIATMEEIKSSTVVFHLNKARKTLEAVSLPQATAIATKLHLI